MSVAKSRALRKVKYLFHRSQADMTTHHTLAHKRLLVTRAPHQAAKLMRLLHDAGAFPLPFPCIDIAPVTPPDELDAVCAQLHDYDWLIFGSSNMVWILAQRLRELGLQPVWQWVHIATVGHTTAQAVVQHLGTRPAFIPLHQTGAELAASLPLDDGQRILLPQSQDNSNDLADRLRARGAAVHTLTGYQIVLGSPDASLLTQPLDGVIFTSPATVKNFRQLVPDGDMPDMDVFCIGPTTAAVATELGFERIVVPNDYSLNGLLQCMHRHFAQP